MTPSTQTPRGVLFANARATPGMHHLARAVGSVCLACAACLERLRSDSSSPSTCAALILVVAALGAAATTQALASTPAGATSPARVVPACRATQLTAWQAIPFDGAAGSFYYQLEFSNVSRTTCRLFGFPGVAAIDSQNRILGRPATREGGPSVRVVLAPGATAHAVLRLIDVGVFPTRMCRPTTAAGLQIFPPNTSDASIIPESLRVCSSRAVSYLSVRPVHAGVGIPGFSQ